MESSPSTVGSRPTVPFQAGVWAVIVAVGLGSLGLHAADPVVPNPATASGASLVERTCQSCHLLPAPALLDRKTWVNEALKYMGPWLGLTRPNLDRLPDGDVLRQEHAFLDEPVFTRDEWRAVVAYYATHAPEEPPPQPPRPPIREDLPGFTVDSYRLGESPPFVTLLAIDRENRRLFVGDGQDKSLRAVDAAGNITWRLQVPSGPVSLTRFGNDWLVTLIGRVFPSDDLAGQVWSVPFGGGSADVHRLLEGLRRPVHCSVMDVDGDGRDDLVVSAYGNRLGNLSWFRTLPDGSRRETVIEEYAGTLRAIPIDWNGDGLKDLLVLRAQGREGLSVLINRGGGDFTARPLIEQPPTFGYVAVELADMDGDGVPEVLLVNGDSGDYPARHKAFHGVRIYKRTPDGGLAERFFFPMYGAYGVKARDFDGDGHVDLALISFFPDYSARPLETFLLLRGLGDYRFEPHALPEAAARAGRWLVMDAGDIDGDGDDDIVLGSFFRGPGTIPIPPELPKMWEATGPSIMLLRNTRK